MIKTRKELAFYLQADRMMNRGSFKCSVKEKLRNVIFPDHIMNYLIHMRKADYYANRSGAFYKVMSNYHRLFQRKIGIKLGFSISKDVFGYGLVIPHYGTIVVGGGNRIGNYAVLHTSICITNGHKKIGSGLMVSTGAKLTTMENLGDNVTVAANSVVTKSIVESNILLAGAPAVIKKSQIAWYEQNEKYKKRIHQIEELKELYI
jgi:transferase hexapeptide repeat containing protein